MIDKGIVQGSETQAKPLVVGLDTVYVHTDIRQITTEDGSVLYEYHEVQYTKDEYITMMAEQLVVMQTNIEALKESQINQDELLIELLMGSMDFDLDEDESI